MAALWMINPWANRFDVSGGATAEVRGGYAPTTVLDESEPTFLMIVIPNVDLRYRTRRYGTVGLGYSPRAQWRLPNRLSIKRPIFLHQFYADYSVQPTRRLTLDWQVAASVGELDYTAVALAFGPGQAVTPDIDVAQVGVGSSALRIEAAIDPTQRLVFQPRGELRAPIGRTAEAQEQGRVSLPRQALVTFGVAYEIDPSAVDTVMAEVRPGVVNYAQLGAADPTMTGGVMEEQGNVTFFSAQNTIGWNRRLRRELNGTADVGVFLADVVQAPAGSEPAQRGLQAFPVASLRFSGRLYGSADVRLTGNLGTGVQAFFDRISARVEPRGNVMAGLVTVVPPRWRIGVNVAAFTALTPSPRVPVGMGMLEVPESVLAGQTPVTYEINDRTHFEFGTVFSVRGSHFAAENPDLMQVEGWFYVAIRVAGGTARGGEEVAERETESIGVGLRGVGTTAAGPLYDREPRGTDSAR